jgi:hypothetical protein
MLELLEELGALLRSSMTKDDNVVLPYPGFPISVRVISAYYKFESQTGDE